MTRNVSGKEMMIKVLLLVSLSLFESCIISHLAHLIFTKSHGTTRRFLSFNKVCFKYYMLPHGSQAFFNKLYFFGYVRIQQ